MLIYKDNKIKVKIPARYFVDIDKLILKFIWLCKRHKIDNNIKEAEQNLRTDSTQPQNLL